MIITPDAFKRLAHTVAGVRGNGQEGMRRFKAKFGCSPDVCSDLWERLSALPRRPRRMLPKHLLWGLLFLKLYNTESVLAEMVGAERKTVRKWCWIVVYEIKRLTGKVVSDVISHLVYLLSCVLINRFPLDSMGEKIVDRR